LLLLTEAGVEKEEFSMVGVPIPGAVVEDAGVMV
jgi:hypothetical protein